MINAQWLQTRTNELANLRKALDTTTQMMGVVVLFGQEHFTLWSTDSTFRVHIRDAMKMRCEVLEGEIRDGVTKDA